MKDSGPAFPLAYRHDGPCGIETCQQDGMSLRAYIATAALQGMLAANFMNGTVFTPEQRAHHAVLYADALIAELNKSKDL